MAPQPTRTPRSWVVRADSSDGLGNIAFEMLTGQTVPAGDLRYSERDAWSLVFPGVDRPARWDDAKAALVAFAPGDTVPTVQAAAVPTAATAAVSSDAEKLAEIIGRMTASQAAPVDEDTVRRIVAESIRDLPAPVVQVVLPERDMVEIQGSVHSLFERVLSWSHAGLNVYLAGPPGTGKTTLAAQVAHAMGVPFRHLSCHPQMTGVSLFGYQDAQGRYVGTDFRTCYEDGGVFLLDEADNGNGGIIAALNSAVENGHCSFPDGQVKRHPDFRIMVAANTFGTGATAEFAGRNKLDPATLNRFTYVSVEIDAKVEEAMVLAEMGDDQAFIDAGVAWLAKVRQARSNADGANLKPRLFITPRDARDGARIIRLGGTEQDAATAKFLSCLDATAAAKVLAGVTLSDSAVKS